MIFVWRDKKWRRRVFIWWWLLYVYLCGAVRKESFGEKNKQVIVHTFASLNQSNFLKQTNLTEKVDLRLKLHCGNSNLLPCEPTCSCYSVTCLLGSTRSSAVFLVIYLNFWVKPLLVQCSCPSDMFELLDQAPPIPVQLSKSQQTA